jgi:hypothetical protein
MPRIKSLNHYPDRYQEIIRECAIEGKQVILEPMPTTRALSLRGHWYAFVGALKAEARSRKARNALGDDDIIHLNELQATVMVQIENVGGGLARVTFQSREHSWQAAALRAATIVTTDSRPTATNLDETAARLLDIQKEIDNGQE